MTDWADIDPIFGVSVTCGDVTLRSQTPDDIPALLDLAADGLVAEGEPYPFLTDWALLPPERLRRNSASFYFSTWASFSPEAWALPMVVSRGGSILGVQDLRARDFAVARVAATGSWLGTPHRGQGIGTLMRQLACALAFDALGAVRCETEAFADNPASLRVSEKVGYEAFDRRPTDRLGEPADEIRLRLTPERFMRPAEPITCGGAEALRERIGVAR